MNYFDMLYFAKYSPDSLNQKIMRSSVHYKLIYMESGLGSGKIYFDGGQHNIELNDIIILPPKVKYRFECDGKCECIVIGFSGFNYGCQKVPFFYKKDEQHNVTRLLNLMCSEFAGHEFHRKQMLNLQLNAILITLCRLSGKTETKRKVEIDNFNYIIHFLDANSQNGIDIEEIAKMSGLSYHRFRHKFKEYTGISPQQYIIEQRLNFAKMMLETSLYGTSAIAAASGFHSVPQFITCFNKQEGLTPIKYRKKFKATQK